MGKFLKVSALSLCSAGVLVFVINVIITPIIPSDSEFVKVAGSSVFVLRQGLSALTAFLLVLGAIGIYQKQIDQFKTFGHLSFFLVCMGNVTLFAQEWGQIFIIHSLSLGSPSALVKLEGGDGMSLVDFGALTALALFSLGWILFSVSIHRAGVIRKFPLKLIVIGLLATPLLAPLLPGLFSVMVGNTILGLGWFLLGRSLYILAK